MSLHAVLGLKMGSARKASALRVDVCPLQSREANGKV